MKNLNIYWLLFSVSAVFFIHLNSGSLKAQSKKEQIETLIYQKDSLVNVLVKERQLNSDQVKQLERRISNQKDSLTNELRNFEIKLNEVFGLKDQALSRLESLKFELQKITNSFLKKEEENILLKNDLELYLAEINSLKNKLIQSENRIKVEAVPTVKIGNQEWMTEDLRTSFYNNGDPIYEAKSEEQWVEYGNKKLGCYRKLSNGSHVYNGYSVLDQRGIIPPGFVLPSYNHFNQLISFLGGGDSRDGEAVLSMATYPIETFDKNDEEPGYPETIYLNPDGSSGFNARRGGYVYSHGGPASEGNCSYWWTSTEAPTFDDQDEKGLIVVDIGYCSQDLGGGKDSFQKEMGFSVRPIKK